MKIKGNIFNLILKLMIALVVFVAVGTVVFLGMQISGRSRLTAKTEGARPDLTVMRGGESQTSEGREENEAPADELQADAPGSAMDGWQEGDIRYQGRIYRYNDDILTFLFLGIDSLNEVKESKNSVSGGQSDAVFLMVLEPHAKQASIIGINRDTMTDIEVYSKNGNYLETVKGQLCLQHGYGDGLQVSCERSADVVSRLFYNLPLHGYCAINMGAIPLLNDAVGGVELKVLENVKYSGGSFKEGETVHLDGMEAYAYLRSRDTESFNSAGRRLDRQKQYLKEYAKAAAAAMEKDLTLPVKLYSTLSKYMVTDIAVDEVSYLASRISGYTLDEEHIYSLQGETRMGEKFEEFYVDETALYELILKVFYEEVG